MLDMKHKNIGATVSMMRILSGLVGGKDLPEELSGLFDLESDDCDHKRGGDCIFDSADLGNRVSCDINNCPLGPLVDEELAETPLEYIEGNIKEIGPWPK
jgi:hypothetical protein